MTPTLAMNRRWRARLKRLRGAALPALALAACSCAAATARVRPGIEVLLEDSLACVAGQRLGLVTNQTGIDSRGRPTWRLLRDEPRVELVRLFAPEHGLDGVRPAGELVRDERHEASGLPVTSLYQGARVVDPALLAGLDLVLFDIQDIGVRPYTFASTLFEVMKAARQAEVEVLVLDRPNPLGGELVSGLTLDPAFASFIGPYPVPYLHGLTLGELARLVNDRFGIGCRLRVMPMSGWTRDMTFDRTGLPWIPTSPNVPTWDTPLAMSVMGPVGELGSASIGVGTASPFWMVGDDRVDPLLLARDLEARQLPGVAFLPWQWTPASGSWSGKPCRGVRLLILDRHALDPGELQLGVLEVLAARLDSLVTGAGDAQRRMFDKALGTDRVRHALEEGQSLDSLRDRQRRDRAAWLRERRPYLLYRTR